MQSHKRSIKREEDRQRAENRVVTCRMLLELDFTCKKTEFKKPNEAGAAFYKYYTKISTFLTEKNK